MMLGVVMKIAIKHLKTSITLLSRWYGGNEFVILLLGQSKKDKEDFIYHLRTSLEVVPAYKAHDIRIQIKVTTGSAVYPYQTTNLHELIHLSDLDMYRNKGKQVNLVSSS